MLARIVCDRKSAPKYSFDKAGVKPYLGNSHIIDFSLRSKFTWMCMDVSIEHQTSPGRADKVWSSTWILQNLRKWILSVLSSAHAKVTCLCYIRWWFAEKKFDPHGGSGSKKIKRWMPAPNILSSLACDIVGDDLLVLKKVWSSTVGRGSNKSCEASIIHHPSHPFTPGISPH